jgi:hypothetical protein
VNEVDFVKEFEFDSAVCTYSLLGHGSRIKYMPGILVLKLLADLNDGQSVMLFDYG